MRFFSILLCSCLLGAVFSCNSDHNESVSIKTLDDAKLVVASLDTIKSVVLKELRKHSYNNIFNFSTVDLKTSGLTGEAKIVGVDTAFSIEGHCVDIGKKYSTLDLNLSEYSIVESLSLDGSGTILYDHLQASYRNVLCAPTPYSTSSDTLEIMSEKITVTMKQKNIHDVVEVRVKFIKSSDSRQNPGNSESTLSYLKTSSGIIFEW